MELPQIGLQCSQPDCKQLDFLPLSCKCGKQFCSEHFNSHVKLCEVFLHAEAEPRKITDVYKCSQPHCAATSVVPLICEKCGQHFCIKHRHIVDCVQKTPEEIRADKERYNAPVRQFNIAKSKVDNQIEIGLAAARNKGRNKGIANKVQLMKIKNKATGLKTIPTADRVYFNIHHGSPNSQEIVPVFVSKNWSVGRVIDAAAQECMLKNNNNKSTEKKLKLFKKDEGDIVSKNMAELLSCLLENQVIVDGDNLIIEYVDDDCDHL